MSNFYFTTNGKSIPMNINQVIKSYHNNYKIKYFTTLLLAEKYVNSENFRHSGLLIENYNSMSVALKEGLNFLDGNTIKHKGYGIDSVYKSYLKLVHDEDHLYFAATVKACIYNLLHDKLRLPQIEWDGLVSQTESTLEIDNEESEMKTYEAKCVVTGFEDKAKSTVDLIHGVPVNQLKEQDLIELITKAQEEIKAISHLALLSKRIENKVLKLQENIGEYVKVLDSLPE